MSISDDISTEDFRVDFLSSVAQLMWSRANLKLNTKRLYSADGKAVKELLKIANLLYAAHKANVVSKEISKESKSVDEPDSKAAARLPDVKVTRKLASQIIESGSKLFDYLQDERDISADRQKCLRFLDTLSNNLDATSENRSVALKLEQLLVEAKDQVKGLEKQCEDQASDEKTLQGKINKKQGELERNEKRLKSLKSVRPAFMDEYEKLETELEKVYEVYLEKFRNLDYLEHRLDVYSRREREKLEEGERTRKRIQMNVLEKRERDLRGDEDEDLFKENADENSPIRRTTPAFDKPDRRRVIDEDSDDISEEQSDSEDEGSSHSSLSEDDLIQNDEGSDLSEESTSEDNNDSISDVSGSDDNF